MKQFRINIERDDINDVDIIEALSSIDSRFRVFDNSAEWIEKNIKIPGADERSALMCSRCHILNFAMSRDTYCRHCGARMDGTEDKSPVIPADEIKTLKNAHIGPEQVDSGIEILRWDTVTVSSVFLGGLDDDMKSVSAQLKWHEEYSHVLCGNLETLTLSEISEQLVNEEGIITVLINGPLEGCIYQYGNYNDGRWYKVGVTAGYA